MPLKFNTKPVPIMVNDGSKDTTPSVTPMRPTPLLGNWCDLPWSAEESMNLTATPSKLAPRTWAAAHIVAEASQISKPSLAAVSTAIDNQNAPSAHEVTQSDKAYAVESSTLAHAEPSSTDESMADLYLTTPADTMLPEDFDDDGVQQTEPEQLVDVTTAAIPSGQHHSYHPTLLHGDVASMQPAAVEEDESQYDFALNALPSRASHFVDFRRLKQLEGHDYGSFVETLEPVVQAANGHHPHGYYPYYNHYPSSRPHPFQEPQHQQSHGYAPYPCQQLPIVQPVRVGVTQPRVPPRIPVIEPLPSERDLNGCQSRLPVIVLISRFPPPPPPSRVTMDTLLRNGSSFESYYQIIMRWYDKVSKALPKAHPTVPPCPAAEHYLHDFDGWVTQIGHWWTQHFTRHSRVPKPNKKR